MKRIYIPLEMLAIYDKIHQPASDGKFVVDQDADGNSTEDHIAGIEYIKRVLESGAKILPILALDHEDGTFERLDGFKRTIAQKELGYKFIEAFVVTKEEFRRADFFPFRNLKMRAWYGGQDGDDGKFPLFEGEEQENWKYEDAKFLFKSPHGDGLRIELAECIHIHWGASGKYRLALGRKDFEELAKAVSSL